MERYDIEHFSRIYKHNDFKSLDKHAHRMAEKIRETEIELENDKVCLMAIKKCMAENFGVIYN